MKFAIKKQLAVAALVWAFSLPNFAQNVPKTMLRLPDTGQTQSFTNTPGEDSDFDQNPPLFVVNGDGTVTDMVTGLMWQQTDGGEMTIESAETYCQNLALGGYANWRLPTAQEAFSILNHGKQNPPLDPSVFPNSGAEYWWTGERQIGNSDKIWVTNAGGGIGNHPKGETVSAGGTKKFHVRAVRDAAPLTMIFSQFTNLDSIILDNLTALEWQRFALADSMNWENALVFAENLTLQGKSDWRLPNIKELESLNDETQSQPSVNFNFFQGINSKKYWSSTSLPNQTTQAWFMDTRFGVVSHELKTARNQVLCVRGQSGETTQTSTISTAGFRVYPNPFYAKIWVESYTSEDPENLPKRTFFQLFDGLGRLAFSGENISEIDFSGLPPGVYFLKISGTKSAVARLLKI
jgi:hypothetical protein